MAEIQLMLGRSDGSREVGMQPPYAALDQDSALAVDEVLADHREKDLGQFFETRAGTNGKPYTEIGFSKQYLCKARASTLDIANNIARVLRDQGHSVAVNPHTKSLLGNGELF